MNKAITIIRLIATIPMLYFIYKETGIFTSIFALSVTIYIELDIINDKNILEFMKSTNKTINKIIDKIYF